MLARSMRITYYCTECNTAQSLSRYAGVPFEIENIHKELTYEPTPCYLDGKKHKMSIAHIECELTRDLAHIVSVGAVIKTGLYKRQSL